MAMRSSPEPTAVSDRSSEGLLPELVEHLRQNRTVLREEWARRITDARLLTAMTPEEIFSEATSVYDNYVEVLETGSVEALQDYARNLSERIIPRGVETDEVLGIVLLLRDVLARSLFEKYQTDFDLLNRVLDAYEPAANRIANTVAVELRPRARAHHSPAAGGHPRAVDAGAAGAGTAADPPDHRRLRRTACPAAHRAAAARHPRQPRARGGHRHHRRAGGRLQGGQPPYPDGGRRGLDGRDVIVTGLSSEIALTLVTIGVDLSKMNAVGDLQGGLEEAERVLGYEVTRRVSRPSISAERG